MDDEGEQRRMMKESREGSGWMLKKSREGSGGMMKESKDGRFRGYDGC